VPAFQVKVGANDLNCVGVPLNPTYSEFNQPVFKEVFQVKPGSPKSELLELEFLQTGCHLCR